MRENETACRYDFTDGTVVVLADNEVRSAIENGSVSEENMTIFDWPIM